MEYINSVLAFGFYFMGLKSLHFYLRHFDTQSLEAMSANCVPGVLLGAFKYIILLHPNIVKQCHYFYFTDMEAEVPRG